MTIDPTGMCLEITAHPDIATRHAFDFGSQQDIVNIGPHDNGNVYESSVGPIHGDL